ncbi:MAG: hypothetical protein F4Z15_09780 [Gammaproteobacteria bacterium]|nr:hypothetical protein [Gammaproteobacteria bacterium]
MNGVNVDQPSSNQHFGLNTWIKELLEANSILDGILIYQYCLPPSVQARASKAGKFFDVVMDDKKTRSVSFWDAYLYTLLREKRPPTELFDQVLFHNGIGEFHAFVSREELSRSYLSKFLYPPMPEKHFALASLALTNDCSLRHIPMIDFACNVNPQHTSTVRQISERIFDCEFVLFESGNSYHAYGMKLQNEEERIKFLGRALLFAPVTDKNYIAHQLQQGMSSLRISSSQNAIVRVQTMDS